MKGVDLNQYRNLPDYGQLQRDGYEFAIIKLATGLTFRNPLFEEQYDGGKAAGLHLGVYTRAEKTVGDGAREAEYALDILGGRYVELPIYYDVEGDTLNASKDALTQMVLDFGAVMSKAGHRWGLYTSRAHFKHFDLEKIKAAGASIWCAAYNNVGAGMDCDIWQNSSSGSVTGYSGPVDTDILLNEAIIKEEAKVKYTNSALAEYTLISPSRSSPRENAIDTLTIHCFVGQCSVQQGCKEFQPRAKGKSCNYVVAYDGKIGLVVEEKDRSWCSSNWQNDARAVTIEVASDNSYPYAVTDAAYEATIKLAADICRRNGIKKLVWSANKADRINHRNGCNMTVHRDYANKECPGQYLYERMPDIAAKVNRLLGVPESEIVTPAQNETPVLYVGCRGGAVKRAQERLSVHGYACTNGGADGIFGYGTRAAVMAFQRSRNLTEDGIIGENTWAALLKEPTQAADDAPDVSALPMLSEGSHGTYVQKAQKRLIDKGFSCGSYGADGWFGAGTRAAVIYFQQVNGLSADGIIGPLTWAKLIGG